jgi:hypothetical protein
MIPQNDVNLKKLNCNYMNVVIAHPKDEKQKNALTAVMEALNIKFEEEKPYNKTFVAKIKKGKRQYENGQFIKVNKKQINELLGL